MIDNDFAQLAALWEQRGRVNGMASLEDATKYYDDMPDELKKINQLISDRFYVEHSGHTVLERVQLVIERARSANERCVQLTIQRKQVQAENKELKARIEALEAENERLTTINADVGDMAERLIGEKLDLNVEIARLRIALEAIAATNVHKYGDGVIRDAALWMEEHARKALAKRTVGGEG